MRAMLLLSATTLSFLLSTDVQGKSVPFVPTPEPVVQAMLDLAGVRKGDVVYDLGSGDGRIVIAAARRGARAVGVDIDPERVREATRNAERAGLIGRTEFRQSDLFEADLREATVVTLYLLPDVNLKLRGRLLEQLRPGTRIVSHDFDMGEWRPEKTERVQANGREHVVYKWVVPAVTGKKMAVPAP